jgi:hypothetical protein
MHSQGETEMTLYIFELVQEDDLTVLKTRRIKAGHEETAWRRLPEPKPGCFWSLADVY